MGNSRREQILEAARQLLLTGGRDAVTVAALVDRAKASVGSLYHHFNNKDGVLEALAAHTLERYHGSLLAALDWESRRPSDIKRTTKTIVRHHAAFVQRAQEEARVLAALCDAEGLLGGPVRAPLRSVIAEAVMAQKIATLSPALYSAFVLGPLLAMREPLDADELEFLARATWRGLRA